MASARSYHPQDQPLHITEWNERTFRELFDHFYISLLFYAQDILQDKAEAQDAVQEVFTRLWQHRPDLNSALHIRSYLYKSTRFCCIDHLRQMQRRDARYGIYLDRAMNDVLQDSRMIEEELYGQIIREIELLPEKYGQILKLKYIDQLDYPEIAARLRISEPAIRKQKQRAMELLKTQVLKNKLLCLALISPFLEDFS